MKIFLHLLIVLTIWLAMPSARADQYQWISLLVSTNAVAHLPAGSVVISYCSQCDGQRAELWRVERAILTVTEATGHYEIQLFVRRLFQTRERFDEGNYKEPVLWQTISESEKSYSLESIDLAYIYVRQPDGSFQVLADVLKLKPLNCAVKALRLPPAISHLLEKQPARGNYGRRVSAGPS